MWRFFKILWSSQNIEIYKYMPWDLLIIKVWIIWILIDSRTRPLLGQNRIGNKMKEIVFGNSKKMYPYKNNFLNYVVIWCLKYQNVTIHYKWISVLVCRKNCHLKIKSTYCHPPKRPPSKDAQNTYILIIYLQKKTKNTY